MIYHKGFLVLHCIFILILSLLVAGCGQGGSGGDESVFIEDTSTAIDPNSISYQTVYDLSEAYQIQMPANWLNFAIADFADDPHVLTAYVELRENDQDLYLENFILFKGEHSEVSSFPEGVSELEILSNNPETLGQHEAEIELGRYKYDPSSGPAIRLGYMLIKVAINGTYYSLQYTAELNRFNTYTNVAKKVFASWLIGVVIENDIPYVENTARDYDAANVATDRTNYLVTYCLPKTRNTFSLKAKLISSDGEILNTMIIADDVPLYFRKNCKSAVPKVIFDGTNYLVTYTKDSTVNSYTDTTLYSKRINQLGEIIDLESIEITTFKNHLNQSSHDLEFDGTRSIIVWYDSLEFEDSDPSRRILGAFISPDNSLTETFTIHEYLGSYGNPALTTATAGSESILVSFQELWSKYEFKEIGLDGALLSNYVLEPSWDYIEFQRPNVVASNDKFLFNWSNASNIYAYWLEDGNVVTSDESDDPMTIHSFNDGLAYLLNSNALDDGFEFLFQRDGGIYSIVSDVSLANISEERFVHPGAITASINLVFINKIVNDDNNSLTVTTFKDGSVIGWF